MQKINGVPQKIRRRDWRKNKKGRHNWKILQQRRDGSLKIILSFIIT
jgi:hypothetical protein